MVAERWWVLWTKSHCERLVRDGLGSRGFEVFLPEIECWSRRGGLRHVIRVPMFPGYLFFRNALDKAAHVEVRKARGLVSLLRAPRGGAAAGPHTRVGSLQSGGGGRRAGMAPPYPRVRRRRRPAQRVLVLGTSPLARFLVEEIGRRHDLGWAVVDVVDDIDKLDAALERTRPDRIVVGLRGGLRLPFGLLLEARARGIH